MAPRSRFFGTSQNGSVSAPPPRSWRPPHPLSGTTVVRQGTHCRRCVLLDCVVRWAFSVPLELIVLRRSTWFLTERCLPTFAAVSLLELTVGFPVCSRVGNGNHQCRGSGIKRASVSILGTKSQVHLTPAAHAVLVTLHVCARSVCYAQVRKDTSRHSRDGCATPSRNQPHPAMSMAASHLVCPARFPTSPVLLSRPLSSTPLG